MTVFELPEHIETDDGEIRRVGFELEFAGVSLEQSAAIMQEVVGGEVEPEGAFRYHIDSDEYGTFTVELDAALLQDGKYRDYLSAVGIDMEELPLKDKLVDVLKDVASTVVPCEIVMPPLPMNRMQIVETIVQRLRKEKARGTKHSVLYAFGLHMNAELVCNDADYLLSHIRAFALLYDWISESSEVDMTRRLSPYIDPWPDDYVKHVLNADYSPDITTLIDDYMELVGSRNHALDMLPAFANIDKDPVMKRAKEPDLIKPRPAFHYRLANSLIDQPDWNIANEWWYWVQVETLAHDRELLYGLCKTYLSQRQGSIFSSTANWVKLISRKIQ